MATYILFWNPAISSYSQGRFEDDFWYGYGTGSWSFYRNAVKGVEPTDEYLVLFLRNLLLAENNELKNRYLHISAGKVLGTQRQSSQESSQETTVSSQEKPGSILKMLKDDPCIDLQEIAIKLNMTRREVQKITDKLKYEGKLECKGSTKSDKWVVKR